LKTPLSTTEMESLREEKHDLQTMLKEAEGYGEGTGRSQDASLIKKQIDRIDIVLEEGKPGKLTSMQRDALAKEAHELEEKFRNGLPTKYEMDHPAKCPGAVRKHMKWLERNDRGLVERYRTIQRLLNPGEELSVESLRKEK
jgi:hypothetical protein